ncbi:hypothetical protein CDL15_Pgr022062 [Punica granatum]|uniref:Uncharacterized protein n=1 Tax=Punica granatum TaxID=22663 RepID=A0A218VS12_PUNGR|nr:hypothetical protein CDL15_Pgr022062 [Punica granatum]
MEPKDVSFPPWDSTVMRLPPPLHVANIRPSIPSTVEPFIDEWTGPVRVQWVALIIHLPPFTQITASQDNPIPLIPFLPIQSSNFIGGLLDLGDSTPRLTTGNLIPPNGALG